MVCEKQEKLLNTQNVKILLKNIMPKRNLHPNWFPNTPILCDGKPLGLIGSTKSELQVDMWLANHPFYTKSQVMIDSEGRVERFMKKYGLNLTDQ
jgi:large subunit ribosomal protein L31